MPVTRVSGLPLPVIGSTGAPSLPSDVTVGTATARMVCWGGSEWTSQSAGTYTTWKNNGWGGWQATEGSPSLPTSGQIATATAAGFESYLGPGYYDNSQSGSYWGTWAGNVASVGMTGLSFDTEQNVWANVTNSTAQANGLAIGQAMWTAFPSMVLLWYHYYLPGSLNDLFYQTVDASPNPHTFYQQDAFFEGILAGMQAASTTGHITLVDATFYRDAPVQFGGSSLAAITNKNAYFYNSQGSRGWVSSNWSQSLWNFGCDKFDITAFTWRGTDGTGFYNNTEPSDAEWAQSVMDARQYSEGPRRAEYVFDSQWPPTPEMHGGTNEPWTYTDTQMLSSGGIGAIPASSTTPFSTVSPTLTSVTATLSAGTATITCNAAHAYGVRYVKVYNGTGFNPSNPSLNYLGAMNMTWTPNGGSPTTNYNAAYQACTFTTPGVTNQWFVLEAVSVKDDTHWTAIQVTAGGGGGGGGGGGTPSVAQQVGLTEFADSTTLASGAITTTSGNAFMVVVYLRAGSAVSVSSVTDTAGNTWVAAATPASSGTTLSRIEAWETNASSPTALSGGTVTIHFSGTCSAVAKFFEINGGKNTNLVDQAQLAVNTALTSATSGATSTLAAANELAIGVIAANSNPSVSGLTFTQGTPSTSYSHSESPASNDLGMDAGTLVITSTTGQAVSGTLQFSTAWGAAVLVLAL